MIPYNVLDVKDSTNLQNAKARYLSCLDILLVPMCLL